MTRARRIKETERKAVMQVGVTSIAKMRDFASIPRAVVGGDAGVAGLVAKRGVAEMPTKKHRPSTANNARNDQMRK